ncbi:MAG: hypothetical protein ACR2G3_11600 [Solirubrobacterales bacterium]
MDLFEASCQGLGLALAIGMFGGALAGIAQGKLDDGRALTGLLLILAAVGGGIAFGASLRVEDHPAWPGWIAGAVVAGFALLVAGSVVAAASERAGDGGSAAFIAAITAAAALVLAALSLTFAAPISLVGLAALAFIAINRRRRAAQKYEGLRILRG